MTRAERAARKKAEDAKLIYDGELDKARLERDAAIARAWSYYTDVAAAAYRKYQVHAMPVEWMIEKALKK